MLPPRIMPGLGLKGFGETGEYDFDEWTNENWRIVSVLLQGRVFGLLSSLPGSPNNGEIYIVTSGVNAQSIAVRDNDEWVYITPLSGWRLYDTSTGVTFEFDGSAWQGGRGLYIDQSASNTAPQHELRKKGSTAGADAPNAAYSTLGAFLYTGWTGAAWRVGAQMIAQTQELWSNVASGTAIVWQVIAPGTTALVDRLQLRADALVPAQTDAQVDLGGPSNRWRNVHAQSLVLRPGSTPWPNNNGEVVFALTANNNLQVRVRGTDGVVRMANLTLAT